jgi:hypothetical protein
MKNVGFSECFIVPFKNKDVYTSLLTTPLQISA